MESTKDLIEQLRRYPKEFRLVMQAADALERLTQPVGELVPVAAATSESLNALKRGHLGTLFPPQGRLALELLYSSSDVARLIAERDEEHKHAFKLAEECVNLESERDALQGQVKVLRDAAFEAKIVLDCTGGRSVKLEEALAATKPKGGDIGCGHEACDCRSYCKKEKKP